MCHNNINNSNFFNNLVICKNLNDPINAQFKFLEGVVKGYFAPTRILLIRIVKCNDHTVDRQGGKKSRDKSNPNRKSEKSTISGQKSPFKSKYTADKQFSRAPFGHSGLSSKSFSRRHIQENAPTFYSKPAKLGKIAKELKKQPTDISSAKKKSAKNYSPIRITSDAHPDETQMISVPSCSNSSMHMSSSDKNNNRSPENAPRHRKCYTNSKHAEFTKTLKLLDKCQAKDIKVSQSVGNLKKTSTSDDVKHASADDIHCCVEKDDITFNKDMFLKTNIHKASSKNENIFFANNYCATANITKPNTVPKETMSPKESVSASILCVNFANDDTKMESDQPKSNLSYFYKGTDNKMNLEGSDISGVKILLRGDLLGALNCLFPQLNLVASESNPKKPQLDPNFSYFSDSSDILMETFTLAKRLHIEQTRKPTEVGKKTRQVFCESVTTLLNQNEKNSHSDECSDECKSSIRQNATHIQHLAVRGIVSAKDLHFDSTKDSSISKVLLGNRFQQQLKYSQSESKISTIGSYRSNLNNGLESSSSEENSSINLPSKDRVNNLRDIENIITAIDKMPTAIDEQKQIHTRFEQTVQNGSESCRRSLYSSVLKRSMSNNDNAYTEKKLVQTSTLVDCQINLWDETRSDILASPTDENKNDNISSFTLDSPIFTDNADSQKSSAVISRVPVSYDLDELEKDIVKTLEKLIDEPDVIPPFNQYTMQNSGLSNSTTLNDPTSAQFLANHSQKYNESYHRKQTVGNTSPTNSLQSRLNFLRTKGRPSDFEQFFNPLAFNTQLAAQFLRQDNMSNNITSMPIDNSNPINQLFPRADITKMPTSTGYYQQGSVNTFERDIKELLTRYPQIVQNNSTNINQQNLLTANSNLASGTPFDLASLYAHIAATKSQVPPLPQPLTKPNNTDENLILNQFIASQSLENMYNNNAGFSRFPLTSNKFSNHIPYDSSKHSTMGSAGMGIGMLNQESFPTPNYLDTSNFTNNNFTSNAAGGMRTIISVSDLEKQALEQYRNSEESINARYDVLEKEAEEQYNNCLSQK